MNNENFGNIQGCLVYYDDLVVFGGCLGSHDRALNNVLERARQYRVNEVKYLGNTFNKEMQPDDDKIEAIIELEEPKNKKELQRMLGMINYLRSLIPNLSSV